MVEFYYNSVNFCEAFYLPKLFSLFAIKFANYVKHLGRKV